MPLSGCCAAVLSVPSVQGENYFLEIASRLVIPRATRCAEPEDRFPIARLLCDESAFLFKIQEKSRFLASLGMTILLFQRLYGLGH
jgi:hypothetical protein